MDMYWSWDIKYTYPDGIIQLLSVYDNNSKVIKIWTIMQIVWKG